MQTEIGTIILRKKFVYTSSSGDRLCFYDQLQKNVWGIEGYWNAVRSSFFNRAHSCDGRMYTCDTINIVQHASNLAVVVVYLLSKGYVIPVCVRVIQIFTGTERVSG